ncbi:MAG: aminoglycoside phosphotransferase family protein [Nanoarchaeota archaeon]|nr:aminoglycoside phosphotransferase family protein [Nanoarchaeota archaeon]
MKLLYQNYNKVYLSEENGQKVVTKIFENLFCWENETRMISFFKKQGLPVPEILNSEPLKNSYLFLEGDGYNTLIRNSKDKIGEMLSMLNRIHTLIPVEGIYQFDRRRITLLEKANNLLKKGVIGDITFEKLGNLCNRYSPSKFGIVHGDFRPSNFIHNNGLRGMIDLEFSGIDDQNKDLAYLWVSAVEIEKSLNQPLIKSFNKTSYFDKTSFDFWRAYMHVMILLNPFVNNSQAWAKNLDDLVS